MADHQSSHLGARHAVHALAETWFLAAAFLAAFAIRLGPDGPARNPPLALAVFHAVVLQVCFYYHDLYGDAAMRWRLDLVMRAARAFLFGTLVLALAYFAVPALRVGRGILLLYLPLAALALALCRGVYWWAARLAGLTETVLVLGTGQLARQIAHEALPTARGGYRLAGVLGEHQAEVGRPLSHTSVVGVISDLPELVNHHEPTLIVVALEEGRGRLPVSDLLRCRMAGVRIEEGTSFFERLTGRILVKNLRPSWLVFSQGFRQPRVFRNSRRAGEFLLALGLLVLFAPLIGLLALLVKLTSPGPVFYRQERVGERGRTFELIKFRTMRVDAEVATGPVWASATGDSRTTPLGRFMRKARLDELPQLINVVRGDMGFVGPRPERPHFVEMLGRVISYYDERHSVKPGITGWAQIKFGYGSNIEDAEKKLQYDLYYIKHMSFFFDLQIIFETVKVMLLGRGSR